MAHGNVRRVCHAPCQDGDEDDEEDDDEDDDEDEDLDEEAAAQNTVVIRELNHDGSEMADTDVRPSKIWSCQSVVLPQTVDNSSTVHNGKTFVPIKVSEEWLDTSLVNLPSLVKELCITNRSSLFFSSRAHVSRGAWSAMSVLVQLKGRRI